MFRLIPQGVPYEELEDVQLAMQQCFELEWNIERYIDRWAKSNTYIRHLGEKLFRSGILKKLKESKESVNIVYKEVFSVLEESRDK